MEVIPVADDNFSDFYRSRLQPPSFDALYEKMIQSGLRPSGRCLSFLIQHARTTDEGLRYMRDSGEFEDLALLYLAGGSETRISPVALNTIPPARLAEFISMICRFVPRAAFFAVDTNTKSDVLKVRPKDKRSGQDHPVSQRGIMRKMQSYAMSHIRRGHPLHQAIFLLTQSRTHFRPAWYALFKALSRRNIILSQDLGSDSENDRLAWRIVVAALHDFHHCGLELDPYGFHLICRTFEKFAKAAAAEGHVDQASTLLDGSRILKTWFRKLSESEERPHKIPKLLHSIKGVDLHQYIRCLGIIEDYDEIIFVLNWMFEHHRELEEIGSQARNGPKQLRRALIAIKLFCSGTEYEENAREIVDQVERWDGWPRDIEVELYVGQGADGDMGEKGDMEEMMKRVKRGHQQAIE
jgi:hypothetical protein